MRNVVGQIASKEDFYYRKKEIGTIMRNLDAKANIQIAAPRRVGKSSILYYLKDNPSKGYINLYIEVESSRSKNDYYRKIFREILKSDVISSTKKIAEQFKSNKNGFLGRLKGIKLAGLGFDFTEPEAIDYEEELTNLLLGIDLGEDKLILMIDEFPEVMLNIVEDCNGDIVEAKKFLQSNRELRNNPKLHGRIQFIYTGSNSLNLTAANLESTSLINDLTAISVNPLSADEAKDLILEILKTYKYTISQEQLDYMVSLVEWNIPFYFQLLIQEIINQIEPEDIITNKIIDESFFKIMDQRNDHHFEHYVRRLKRVFNEKELRFVKIFLNQLAQNEKISKGDAQNMSHGILTESETKKVLEALRYDGYVINQSETGNLEYKFNSPILKQWWYNHEC
ncbi:hypothetical protein LZZ90_00650 [Flavobacterium sp. SM15]|uniref:hypothetical protein n=1 Tax=Flavobacterium sp. SM15 TaxID=2908005 RepID=UPI001EDB33CA|nr:hypothetical protein [Flavobacterium sp. SM15]MCG2610011.1 hypothetical protein [Flavobacterium sp. SM15]